MQRIFISLCMFWLIAANVQADIFSSAPEAPNPSDKYLFYLHGSVEESEGETEKYEMAIEAAGSGSAHVISEVRDDTDPNTYATGLKKQVNHLLAKGVPAKHITISGFSKGAVIALATASLINNPQISYVLLAGCSDELNEKYDVKAEKAVGRILAIYDSEDDKFGSCSGTLKTDNGTVLEETELDSGKGHKVFRIPKEKFIEQWRDPMLDWIQ
jgi:predicted esterase